MSSNDTPEDILTQLRHAPIVPLVQADDPSTAVKTANALLQGGLKVIEVVLRTDAALRCLADIAAACPTAIVGAGTVLSASQVAQCADGGARFIVSPGLDRDVVAAARARCLPVFPGVATASETQAAWNIGLRTVKFFPAGLAGGPKMIEALGAVFRDMRFMPTGGVAAENLGEYLRLPQVIACGGSWLTPKSAIANGHFDEITLLAAQALATTHQAQG